MSQIWAFVEPKAIGSIALCRGTRWGDDGPVNPDQPMMILREATRDEWLADGGGTNHPGPLYYYAISTD